MIFFYQTRLKTQHLINFKELFLIFEIFYENSFLRENIDVVLYKYTNFKIAMP